MSLHAFLGCTGVGVSLVPIHVFPTQVVDAERDGTGAAILELHSTGAVRQALDQLRRGYTGCRVHAGAPQSGLPAGTLVRNKGPRTVLVLGRGTAVIEATAHNAAIATLILRRQIARYEASTSPQPVA